MVVRMAQTWGPHGWGPALGQALEDRVRQSCMKHKAVPSPLSLTDGQLSGGGDPGCVNSELAEEHPRAAHFRKQQALTQALRF